MTTYTAPPSNLEFKVTTAEPSQKIMKTWANSGPPCPELSEFELLCKSLKAIKRNKWHSNESIVIGFALKILTKYDPLDIMTSMCIS